MWIVISMIQPRKKITSLPFIKYTLNEYELNTSNNLYSLFIGGSALHLIICVKVT